MLGCPLAALLCLVGEERRLSVAILPDSLALIVSTQFSSLDSYGDDILFRILGCSLDNVQQMGVSTVAFCLGSLLPPFIRPI